MRPYTLSAFLVFITLTTYAQSSIKAYVEQNTIQISSISPDSLQYDDLTPVGNAIGNAKVVMLGEQDHGDAPTFLAKTRIIKYLHEVKGFNVLAFEEDFFSLNQYWADVESGNLDVNDFIKHNTSVTWGLCDACSALLQDYIPATRKTNAPLKMTGFDDIMNTVKLLPQLDSLLHRLQLPITKDADYYKTVFPLLQTWYKFTKDSANNIRVNNYLAEIKNQMLEKLNPDDFWIRIMENFIQLNKQFYNAEKGFWLQWLYKNNARDTMMAMNLKWLNEVKYPTEKIIVWAHNYHVSRNTGNYPDKYLNAERTMGTVFTKDSAVRNRTYILAFTSYRGTAGRIAGKTYKIRKPESNSLENWISKSYNYAYVDFKKFDSAHRNEPIPFFMAGATKGSRYHASQLGDWTKIYDGVFFIRDMYPCKQTGELYPYNAHN